MASANYCIDRINNIAHIDNRDKDSHYRRLRKGNVQFICRVSNHHTVLATWVECNSDLRNSKNICIVFLDDISSPTYDDNKIEQREFTSDIWQRAFPDLPETFVVKTYVYDCKKLDETDIIILANQINGFFDGRLSNFSDPLQDDRDKRAICYDLIPNRYPIKTFENLNITFSEYISDLVMTAYFSETYVNIPAITQNCNLIKEDKTLQKIPIITSYPLYPL